MNTIIYKSHFELLQSLTNEQAGILIKAIGEYCSGIYPEINDLLVKGIFISIKRDFDLQAENYEKKVKRNQENGKNGGRPKKPTQTEDNPNNPMGFSLTHNNPKNLKDKDKDKDKDIEKDIDTSSASSIATCNDSSLINKLKREEDLAEVLNNIFGN